MVKGKTKSGFAFEANEKQMENAEFLENFVELQKNNGLVCFDMVAMLLGKDGKQALYDHIRTDDGIVPVERLTDEIKDIFEKMDENVTAKN